jgi:hypothetical protein
MRAHGDLLAGVAGDEVDLASEHGWHKGCLRSFLDLRILQEGWVIEVDRVGVLGELASIYCLFPP